MSSAPTGSDPPAEATSTRLRRVPSYSGLVGLGGFASGTGLAPTPGTQHFVFGRRSFFGYLVRDDGTVYWFSNLTHPEVSQAELRAVPAQEWLTRLRDLHRDDLHPVPDILAAADNTVGAYAIYDLPVVPRWHRGRVVCIGDAVHATSPSAGQGASLALEDAQLLAQCLRDFGSGEVRPEPGEPPRKATEEELVQCLTDGDACQAVGKALAKYQDRLHVNARHDSARDTVMALVRLGEQGHHGVQKAIKAMQIMFTNAVASDRIDGSEGPEFDRMVDGAVVKVLADPTADEDKRCCGSTQNRDDIQALTKNLPEEFWSARQSLQKIRQAVHSRGRSGDIALYTVMARISSMLSPHTRFENLAR